MLVIQRQDPENAAIMSSPWKKQPEEVVDSVLKRAEVSKVSLHPLHCRKVPRRPVAKRTTQDKHANELCF